MANQVTCIRKRNRQNPHERIEGIGGVNPDGRAWYLPEDQAIADIKAGIYSFYTNVNGRVADVIVALHNGREYLKTTADGYSPDDLLSLAECP